MKSDEPYKKIIEKVLDGIIYIDDPERLGAFQKTNLNVTSSDGSNLINCVFTSAQQGVLLHRKEGYPSRIHVLKVIYKNIQELKDLKLRKMRKSDLRKQILDNIAVLRAKLHIQYEDLQNLL